MKLKEAGFWLLVFGTCTQSLILWIYFHGSPAIPFSMFLEAVFVNWSNFFSLVPPFIMIVCGIVFLIVGSKKRK